jgi:uncharacterized protein (TIGR03435 family)
MHLRIGKLVVGLALESTSVMAQHLPPPGARGGPPDIPKSYTVQIRPTLSDSNSTSTNSGPSWYIKSGFTLRDMLGEFYNLPANRINFDDSQFASERLDIALNLPEPESEEATRNRIIRALEERLRISVKPVNRLESVYAITVADPAKLVHARTTGWTYGSHSTTNISVLAIERQRQTQGIALDSVSMDGDVKELCRILEQATYKPFIDHTGFHGSISLTIERGSLNRDQFFARIEEQYGLAIRPATAQVEHITVTHNSQ